jgi:hypothetical protein
LLGILSQEGRFRATDVFFFNDSSEVRYALELMEKALPEVRLGCGLGPARHVLDAVIEQVAKLRQLGPTYRMYAVCFCAEPDLLSQWRGYGASGGGFALGFSCQAMLDYIGNTELGISKVWYDPADQLQLVKETVSSACKTLERVAADSGQFQGAADLVRETASFVLPILCQFAVTLKSPAFREEREWRVVDYDLLLERDINFAVRRGIAVPCVSLSLPLSALRQIQIGPNLEPESASRSVGEIVRRYCPHQVTVSCSAIPLRG